MDEEFLVWTIKDLPPRLATDICMLNEHITEYRVPSFTKDTHEVKPVSVAASVRQLYERGFPSRSAMLTNCELFGEKLIGSKRKSGEIDWRFYRLAALAYIQFVEELSLKDLVGSPREIAHFVLMGFRDGQGGILPTNQSRLWVRGNAPSQWSIWWEILSIAVSQSGSSDLMDDLRAVHDRIEVQYGTFWEFERHQLLRISTNLDTQWRVMSDSWKWDRYCIDAEADPIETLQNLDESIEWHWRIDRLEEAATDYAREEGLDADIDAAIRNRMVWEIGILYRLLIADT